LISVYVPAGYDLNLINSQLSQEKGTASNIKSTATRKNVENALSKILQELKLYKKTPENGMAIFCGNIGDENKADFRIWVIEPPQPLTVKVYRCDQTFLLEPLMEMMDSDQVYGLIVLDNKTAAIGLLKGKYLSIENEMESLVPGKYKTGGQSAARFSRVRENLKKDWYGRVEESARQIFEDQKHLKGIIVGGPGPAKDDFVEQLHTDMKNLLMGTLNIGYSDSYGLKVLVDEAGQLLEKAEVAKEKKLLKRFFNLLSTKEGIVTYGIEKTKKALENGVCDILLLSEKLDEKVIKELKEIAENFSTKVELISNETEEGKQFKQIGGVGSILRFEWKI
jgi:peptide chain release factor subunit 1